MLAVTIEQVRADAMELLGFTPHPSYPAWFRSALVSGWARFVPFGNDPVAYVGRSLLVELSQESISELAKLPLPESGETVEALPIAGNYMVRGTVSLVQPVTEPPGNFYVVIRASEASFFLSQAELAGAQLSVGDTVTFAAIGLSLWDEEL